MMPSDKFGMEKTNKKYSRGSFSYILSLYFLSQFIMATTLFFLDIYMDKTSHDRGIKS